MRSSIDFDLLTEGNIATVGLFYLFDLLFNVGAGQLR